jgi:hypothetical protein
MSNLTVIIVSKKVCKSRHSIHNNNQNFRFIQVFCSAFGCTSCTKPGQKHFCSNCGDRNSKHCSKNCPLMIYKTVKIYCSAFGCTSCTKLGQKHFCSNCGDRNSKHCSKDCKK